jgi:hypothetical protein
MHLLHSYNRLYSRAFSPGVFMPQGKNKGGKETKTRKKQGKNKVSQVPAVICNCERVVIIPAENAIKNYIQLHTVPRRNL